MAKRTRRKGRLDAPLAAAATPVFALDQRRRIVFFNAGCENLTGWTAEDALGTLCNYIAHADPSRIESLADGLSEELLNQLSNVPELRVIGRTSSFAFKGSKQDLRSIGEALGVNHILEGSVRKSGNRVRINAQLINPADGTQLWSETFERTW